MPSKIHFLILVQCLLLGFLCADGVMAENLKLTYQLPINEVLKVADVRVLKMLHDNGKMTDESASLLNASRLLEQANGMVNNAEGCFMLNAKNQVVGYSLSSYYDMSEYPANMADASKYTIEYVPQIRWQRATSGKVALKSLKGVMDSNSIEFINCDDANFRSEIWKDLGVMSHTGSLRGLSMFCGDNFLDVRNGEVLQNVFGLAIHLNNADKLTEVGDAFPNLTFLCVAFPGRESINSIFRDDLLREKFPNLKALMLGDSLWPDSAVNNLNGDRGSGARIRFDPASIHENVEWIGVDGYMLSSADMVNYDDFGARLRYKTGKSSMKLKIDRNIQVTYMAFGFSAGGARSMRVWEYAQLEKYWRSKPSPNPIQ